MNELPSRRLISIEVPGEGSPELNMALNGLRELVTADGGQMYDRQIMREIDLFKDDDLRAAAACVEPMRAAGLLTPDMQVRDLIVGGEEPQLFGTAEGLKGENKRVIQRLEYVDRYGENITTVQQLLYSSQLWVRDISNKRLALLRQTLIDSGMPEEFPWPFESMCPDSADKLLRGLVLIAPTFGELPMNTKRILAYDLGLFKDEPLQRGDRVPTPKEIEQCSALYAERRREVMRMAGQDSNLM